MDVDIERKTRDLVKRTQGVERVLERVGGSFTFEVGVKYEGWQEPKRSVKASNRKMHIDEVATKSHLDAAWEEPEHEELECGCREPTFQRHPELMQPNK